MTIKHVQHIVAAVFLSLLILIGMVRPASATPSSATSNMQTIDAYITSQMQRLHIPGISLGIVHDTQIVYTHGYGVADPTGRPMTAQTPFVLASISKSFTALAVMQLVEQGKIELDAPVQRYIPWFHIATPGASSQITIRNLLTHTSGLSPYLGGIHPAAPNESIKQFVQEMKTTALTAPVGTKFQYSNANYALLGLVIETVSGKPYQVYIQQHIFDPLQMHTSFTSQAEALKHGLATGYQTFFGAVLPVSAPYHLDIQPAGYLISTATDMTHYLIAQMNHGQFGNTTLLSSTGMDKMHEPEVTTHQTVGGSAEVQAQYAMGWFVGSLDGVSILSHGGDDIDMHGDMIIAPQNHWGVIVLTNMGSLAGNMVGALPQTAEGVMHLLLGQTLPASNDFDTAYYIIDGIAGILTALALWSLVRLLRRRQKSLKRQVGSLLRYLLLPLLWEYALPISLFVGIPHLLGGVSWIGILLYLPDIGYWLLAIFSLLVMSGLIRCTLSVMRLSHESMSECQQLAEERIQTSQEEADQRRVDEQSAA